MSWTPDWPAEREAMLRELWPLGLSLSEMATRMGGGLTRNAVRAKAERIGLPMRAAAKPSAPRRFST